MEGFFLDVLACGVGTGQYAKNAAGNYVQLTVRWGGVTVITREMVVKKIICAAKTMALPHVRPQSVNASRSHTLKFAGRVI